MASAAYPGWGTSHWPTTQTIYPDTPYTRHYANDPGRSMVTPHWPPPPDPRAQPGWGQPAGWPTPATYQFAPLENTDWRPRPTDNLWPTQWPEPLTTPGPVTPMPLAIEQPFGPVAPGPVTPMPMALGTPAIGSFSPFPIPPSTAPFPDDVQPILFAPRFPYWGRYLAARPADWRHDYIPPRRFSCISRLRQAGASRTRVNLEPSQLSRLLLMPNSRVPTMSFDLRSDDPFDPNNLELLTTVGRSFNPTDLAQFATTRPVARLRFYHPRLPWYIDVRASQPNGILVGDILHQIHDKLHRIIRPQDFSNTVLNATDREAITDAYRARCNDDVCLMQQGVKRVDFMGEDCILQGFVEGRDGMWLMKTSQVADDE
ncbi:hypothetical protein FB45DRAFT_830123 [Roridomyces roridus]|uniref:DUF6699 domain-containing protein n=1 Tax=Roridomyces roridus TaxID=1738132 RepID=A0AAD7FR76_9AGAR|nr:hypothetical protein FB45DRAFT_830123 [Roridomyces roridus]